MSVTYRGDQNEKGFVALISVIIMSAILLSFVVVMGTWIFFSRFDTADLEYKQASEMLARSCESVAIQRIATDASYVPAAGGDCIADSGACGTAGAQTCTICSIQTSQTVSTIYTRALVHGAYTNLKVTVDDTAEFAIHEWSELSTYSGPACTVQ
jgi:hypothetical protein